MAHFFLRLFLCTVGRLSRGVSLCFSDGPTAGTTLSYAYRNVPEGRWIVGKWIDRRFLRYPGWERARRRLAAVGAEVRESIAAVRREGAAERQEVAAVHLLDIASGPADYLGAIYASGGGPDSVVCRDLSAASVAAGAARAAALGLRGVRFEVGDALDRGGVMALVPRPNVALSVGLYELLDDGAMAQSIAIVAAALAPGGRFVVAQQIAHADPGVVADLFRTRGQAPVTLYLRTPAALAAALRQAGLSPGAGVACGDGWYIVMTARKEADGPGAV